MAKRALSIFIGADIIRICDVTRKSDKQVILHNIAQFRTPENCVEDGMIVDAMKLALAMNRSIYGTKFETKKVIFTIASKKIATKEIVFPFMKKRERIQEAIKNNAQDYFPMNNLSDFIFAHSILEKIEEEEGTKKIRVSAIAAPKKLIESYYELARFLKIPIDSIDFFGNSVLQMLSLQMSGGCQLVVQIEKESTSVNVMSDKTLLLQRSIPFGKDAIITSLAERKRITFREVELIMKKKDVSEAIITSEEYASAVKYITNGIKRTVEYYRSSTGTIEIEAIKIFGEGSTFPGIERLLEKELGAKVTHFDELKGVTVSDTAALTKSEQLRYLANIGAIINPVCLEISTEKSGRTIKRNSVTVFAIALILAIVVALIMGIGSYFLHSHQLEKNEEIERRIKVIHSLQNIYLAYLEAQADYDRIFDHDATTANDNEYVYEFILELEKRLPLNTQIESLAANNGEISITATTTDKDEVAEFVIQMKESNMVADIFISTMSDSYDTELGEDRVTIFTASCRIHQPIEIEEVGETESIDDGGEEVGGEDEAGE